MNAKDEFLRDVGRCKVIGAVIQIHDDKFELKPGHSSKVYDDFLNFLDREYDDGYGGQQLHGYIFCEDGIWFDRGEYDGSEWWNRNKYPRLTEFFDESVVLRYERTKKLKNIKKLT